MLYSAPAMQREYSSTETTIGVSLFVVIVAALYLIPTLVALARRVSGVGSIVVLNVFLGWTGFWWVYALSLALGPKPPCVSAPAAVAAAASAGWLRDPINPARLRYYDGYRWTDAVSPPKT